MKKPLLHFKQQGLDNRKIPIWYVYNHEDEFLGVINNSHVGRFFHWIFCPDANTFFTNGCLKEVVGFISGLYKQEKKK